MLLWGVFLPCWLENFDSGATSVADLTSGPAAHTRSPRRLLKPRVHWFIGLSERNERRPPKKDTGRSASV